LIAGATVLCGLGAGHGEEKLDDELVLPDDAAICDGVEVKNEGSLTPPFTHAGTLSFELTSMERLGGGACSNGGKPSRIGGELTKVLACS
jgi:hypothetical protein